VRLLRRCLQPDPGRRPAEARDLLSSRFLNPGGRRVPLRAAELFRWASGGAGAAAAAPEPRVEGEGADVLIGVPLPPAGPAAAGAATG